MDGTVRGKSLYEADEHAWMLQQLALIQAGRAAELDLAHIEEFLRDMTASDRKALKSNLARLYQHILKFRAQPSQASRSWRLSVLEHQARVRDELEMTPSLRHYVPELLPDAYERARRFAAEETGLPLAHFPTEPPMTLDEALAWQMPPLVEPTPRRKRR
jgi:hypothetical protein